MGKKLGISQQSRDAFIMLRKADLLNEEIAIHMQKMVGFRDIEVHNCRALSLPVLRLVVNERLGDFCGSSSRIIEIASADCHGKRIEHD